MNDPRKQERRKRMLKERRAAENREVDRDEAFQLCLMAMKAHRAGDQPDAARLARKALNLNPELLPALDLMALLYMQGHQYEQALSCLMRLRRYPETIGARYNLGIVNLELGHHEAAREAIQEFLEISRSAPPKQWKKLRDHAQALLKAVPVRAAPAAVAAPAPQPKGEPPQPAPAPPLVRAAVEFLPAPAAIVPSNGTIADYLLLRRLLDLRLAQSFEDLLCLPTLNGVDTYMYQQETVRRVLRHFKGRALLADEVGLGKTIEACLVMKEYWMRGMARKILVLTPPSLVSQWKGELSEKFGLAPVSPDDPVFRSDPARFWSEQLLVVASIAMARLEPHASTIAATPWDMVVVDEAHCLKNRTSANWKLVNSLNKKFILMLTATPVENNLVELYNLITVLKPGLLATEAEFRKEFLAPGKPKSPRNPERLRCCSAR
jgi:SNF2 family DNA or RNA helicase